MKEKLGNTLEKVDKWLHYAEAKNGFMLAIYLGIFSQVMKLNSIYVKFITLIPLILGLYTLFKSFIPKTNSESGNVLFFYKDISQISSSDEYLKDFKDKYEDDDEWIKDQAKQIHTKSTIVQNKFNLFITSGRLLGLTLVVFFVFFLLEPIISNKLSDGIEITGYKIQISKIIDNK